MGDKLRSFFNFLSVVVGFILLALILCTSFYTLFGGTFISSTVMNIIGAVERYLSIALIGCVTLSFTSNKGMIGFISTAILIAALIIVNFFPSVITNLIK